MSFKKTGLEPSIRTVLQQLGIKEPYPIQKEGIPKILKKQDLVGLAPTGSGKTLCFVLPIIQELLNKKLTKDRKPETLIIVPTRELCLQIFEVIKSILKPLSADIKALPIYGGVSINPKMQKLIGTNLLVATPGRLLDLTEKNAVELSEVKTLVLDEADQVLNLGFQDELEQIINLLPKRKQCILFSATMEKGVEKIANKLLLNNPHKIKLTRETITPDQINQTAYQVPNEKKGPFLRELIGKWEGKQVLVFASSIRTVDNVVQKLKKNKFPAMALHSKKSQGARNDAMTQFRNGKLQILVATDLAARGIDIPFLPYVVNYELPRSPQDYIHRIGRTGRAEQNGVAISFISEQDEHHFGVIQKKMKKQVAFSEDQFLK